MTQTVAAESEVSDAVQIPPATAAAVVSEPVIAKVAAEPAKQKAKVKTPVKAKHNAVRHGMGKASSGMAKPETVKSVKEIPTASIASENRPVHQTSGRVASTADAMSKSSAGPTKP